MEFTDQLIDKIYEEGVIPSQGTRPLFATIQLWINAQFPRILSHYYQQNLNSDRVVLDTDSKSLIVKFISSEIENDSLIIPVFSDQDKIRSKANKDEKYLIAVHEAGHVLASILLLNKIPKKATALSTSGDKGGFVMVQHPRRYFKKDILAWIGSSLAGAIAERQIFGVDHMPVGARQDHWHATNYIVELIKTGIIGEVPGVYGNRSPLSNDVLHDDDNVLTGIASKWLKEAKELVMHTLEENEYALVKLADLLLRHKYLSEKEMKDFADEYLPNVEIRSAEAEGGYAQHFHEKLSQQKDVRTKEKEE